MRIVVTGKTGQVASSLLALQSPGVEVVAIGRPDLDLARPDRGIEAVVQARPDVIVSAAAYTAVDKAETDAKTAMAVNADGPAALARVADELGVPIIHLSTDYVFDGRRDGAYVETDPTGPLGVYGRTKLAGEAAVAEGTANHAILRTAWVYSPFGANFLKTMLRVAATQPRVRVVDDQRGNPTSALDIADAVLAVSRNLIDSPSDARLRGVFHVAGSGEASWADFAESIFADAAALGGPSASVLRIGTADFPTVATRPANSRLDTTRLRNVHGVTMPPWPVSMRQTLRRLLGTVPAENAPTSEGPTT